MSPIRRRAAKPAKRTTKSAARRATKRGAAQRSAAQQAKRPTRRTAKRTAKRAAKRPARCAAKRPAKSAPQRRSARTSALRVVRRPAPKLKSTAFPQRAGASSKQSVLFELMRARAALAAAIQGLPGGSAAEPIAPGEWSVREIVLHLGQRDRETLRALERALTGREPQGPGEDDAENRAALAALAHHGWDGALRLLHALRSELLAAIESVPDEPAHVWTPEHAFGRLLEGSTRRDRRHADAIKRWRTRGPE